MNVSNMLPFKILLRYRQMGKSMVLNDQTVCLDNFKYRKTR